MQFSHHGGRLVTIALTIAMATTSVSADPVGVNVAGTTTGQGGYAQIGVLDSAECSSADEVGCHSLALCMTHFYTTTGVSPDCEAKSECSGAGAPCSTTAINTAHSQATCRQHDNNSVNQICTAVSLAPGTVASADCRGAEPGHNGGDCNAISTYWSEADCRGASGANGQSGANGYYSRKHGGDGINGTDGGDGGNCQSIGLLHESRVRCEGGNGGNGGLGGEGEIYYHSPGQHAGDGGDGGTAGNGGNGGSCGAYSHDGRAWTRCDGGQGGYGGRGGNGGDGRPDSRYYTFRPYGNGGDGGDSGNGGNGGDCSASSTNGDAWISCGRGWGRAGGSGGHAGYPSGAYTGEYYVPSEDGGNGHSGQDGTCTSMEGSPTN